MPLLPRSNWPQVIQMRRGEAGSQMQTCQSKDLGWCAYLSPRLHRGQQAGPRHGAVFAEHASEGRCAGIRLILSHCVLFLVCHKKGTVTTANACRHLGHSALFRAREVHSHISSSPLRAWSSGSPDSGEEGNEAQRGYVTCPRS